MATYWENSCSFGLRYVSWYKYLIVSLVFSQFGFWSGNLFLIAPFPDLCLLVPFYNNKFGNQFIVSAIKFRKCFSKLMIPTALLEKFGCLTFISLIEVRNMIADSSKPNKLRNVLHHKKHGEERHHPDTENLLISKLKTSRLS